MSGVPAKCPKCGKIKAWKEEINAFKSGIPAGGLGRIRFGTPKGLLAKPLMKVMGCYEVTYRCHNCGFRQAYQLEE